MNIIGDVDGRTCVIMDDIVDRPTRCAGGEGIEGAGRGAVVAYYAPGAIRPAVGRIEASVIDELVVRTPSRCAPTRKPRKDSRRERAELLAETVRRICEESSVSSLFVE
jgi:ribose-phosphate pyrophosphokinase